MVFRHVSKGVVPKPPVARWHRGTSEGRLGGTWPELSQQHVILQSLENHSRERNLISSLAPLTFPAPSPDFGPQRALLAGRGREGTGGHVHLDHGSVACSYTCPPPRSLPSFQPPLALHAALSLSCVAFCPGLGLPAPSVPSLALCSVVPFALVPLSGDLWLAFGFLEQIMGSLSTAWTHNHIC